MIWNIIHEIYWFLLFNYLVVTAELLFAIKLWLSDSGVKVGKKLDMDRRLHLTHFIFLIEGLLYFPGKAFHISQPSSVHLWATSSVQWREGPLKIQKISRNGQEIRICWESQTCMLDQETGLLPVEETWLKKTSWGKILAGSVCFQISSTNDI